MLFMEYCYEMFYMFGFWKYLFKTIQTAELIQHQTSTLGIEHLIYIDTLTNNTVKTKETNDQYNQKGITLVNNQTSNKRK